VHFIGVVLYLVAIIGGWLALREGREEPALSAAKGRDGQQK
jgi:hypothetical protein